MAPETRTNPSPRAVELRWQATGDGRRYAGERFRSPAAARRDPRIVRRILARQRAAPASVLDVPCGTGRLRSTLAESGAFTLGVDVSPAMLAEARGPRVRASAWRLPFGADAFDAVVCCRLLHHVRDREERRALLSELVRVSRELVIVSFWDAGSLHAWRRRAGLRRGGRTAISRSELARLAVEVGATPTGFHHSFRFISQQSFVELHKRTS